MQILNISVMNRPAKSYTSRPYSLEVQEEVKYNIDFVDVSLDNINFLEVASNSMGILDGYIRDLLVSYKLREDVSEVVSIADVRITYEVVYTKYKVAREDVSSSIAVQDVRLTREVKYIKVKLDDELVQQSIAITDVKLV